jgi:multiple sugar transport system ATP-binding protein
MGDQVTLRIENLTKIYDEGGENVLAVDDMTVDVKDGEFLVFVGPSGCGKTTTLRCIAGLEEITDGSVIIEGEDVSGQAPRERDIAMVFQTYALYPHMTVRENMEYPLKVRGYDRDERSRQVEETAELLQIPELLDREPADLSGGQQQRVALGRALVREPRVFLFDEPLSNLDAKLRVRMRTELNRLHNKIGKTSIYVTHDQAEAMTLGDRIAVMRDSEIQQIAPPQTVYDEPVNRFVAGFIGSPQMNFFEGSAWTDDGRVVVDTGSFEFTLPETMSAQIDIDRTDSTAVTFGIRPEDLYVESVDAETPDSAGSIDAEVLVVEEMGSNFHLTLERKGTEFQGIVEPDTAIDRGDRVSIDFDLEKCHLFDGASGESLLYGSDDGS